MFAYCFGCIETEDMSFVFADDEDEYKSKPLKDIEHNHAQVLSYLAKGGFIEKIKDGYFILKNKGLKEMYDYLFSNSMLHDISFDCFCNNRIRTLSHFSHSSKSGRTALLFCNSYNYNFLCEPVLDIYGNLVQGELSSYHNKVFVPDSILYLDCKASEEIYVEADSSEGRLNSNILPKLHNYSEIIFKNKPYHTFSTIHFSVWNERQHNSSYCSLLYEEEKIHSLISFIMEMNPDSDYASCFKLIKNYTSNYYDARALSDFIKKYDLDCITDKETLSIQIQSAQFNDIFDKSFLMRQESLFNYAQEKQFFCQGLYEGNRFVCLPVNSNKKLLDFVYFEHCNSEDILLVFSNVLNANIELISHENIYSFFDEINNKTFRFRNVFLCNINGKKKYIIIENISDELGGKLRINNYRQYPRKCSFDEEVIVFCLYNNYSESEMKSCRNDESAKFRKINFLSYKEFIFLKYQIPSD